MIYRRVANSLFPQIVSDTLNVSLNYIALKEFLSLQPQYYIRGRHLPLLDTWDLKTVLFTSGAMIQSRRSTSLDPDTV